MHLNLRRLVEEMKKHFEKVLNSPTTRQIGRTVAQTLTRGLLGVLGVKPPQGEVQKRILGGDMFVFK